MEALPHHLEHHFSRPPQEYTVQDNEKQKGSRLECQASKQYIVCHRGILPVTARNSNQRGSKDLYHSRNNVTRDEDPENQLGRKWRIRPGLGRGDEYGEDGVNCCGEEDWSDHDKEVLNDEVVDAIW